MISGINHIGIAVESIDSTLEALRVFGAKTVHRQSYPELGQTSCMVQLGSGLLELMEPVGDTGVIPKFLREKGPGLHHISLLSTRLEEECAALREKGMRVLGDPDSNIRMVFTHPKETGGVIYEITDKELEI